MPPYRNLYWNASSPSPPISSIFKPAPAPLPHQFPVIIDSGTTLSFLPPSVVRRYASQVPGVGEAGGIYWAPCGTKMPPFGIVIGGRTFLWDASDVLIQDMREFFVGRDGQLAEFCGIGLMDLLPEGPYVLGDNFLKGLVTVFDVGMGEVRLYEKA